MITINPVNTNGVHAFDVKRDETTIGEISIMACGHPKFHFYELKNIYFHIVVNQENDPGDLIRCVDFISSMKGISVPDGFVVLALFTIDDATMSGIVRYSISLSNRIVNKVDAGERIIRFSMIEGGEQSRGQRDERNGPRRPLNIREAIYGFVEFLKLDMDDADHELTADEIAEYHTSLDMLARKFSNMNGFPDVRDGWQKHATLK